MTCALIRNLLDLHAEDRLAAFQSRWVHRHVSRCARCARELAAWRKLFSRLASVAAPAAPVDLKARLLAAAAAARLAPSPEPELDLEPWLPLGTRLAWAACAAAVLLSISASIYGPGLPSQSCSDDASSVCLLPDGAAASQPIKR